MTHILMVSRCPPYPLHLGDRLIVYHLARELAALGFTVDLLAFAETPADWSLVNQQPYTPYFRDVVLFDAPPRPTPEMVRRALLPPARFPGAAAGSFAPEMWREVERRLAATDYDAVHLFGGVQVYDFAAALRGHRTIITPYESYSLYLRRVMSAGRGGPITRAQLWATRRYESWMFTPYDVTTVLSDVDRDELLRLNPGYDVRVIPNGIDPAHFPYTNTTQRDPAHLLFVGNYAYPPNREAALWLARDILPLVRAQVPAAQLSLVGNDPPPELRALASDHITVTGRVPDVGPYLARATVFVCPLRIGAGIKNKVLEALASGSPVVMTPLSAEGIAVTDGESALLAASPGDIAAAVTRLLTDPALAAKLSANGRAVIEAGYTWRAVAEQYAALYG